MFFLLLFIVFLLFQFFNISVSISSSSEMFSSALYSLLSHQRHSSFLLQYFCPLALLFGSFLEFIYLCMCYPSVFASLRPGSPVLPQVASPNPIPRTPDPLQRPRPGLQGAQTFPHLLLGPPNQPSPLGPCGPRALGHSVPGKPLSVGETESETEK